jgi:hypothetical protein
VFGQIVQKSGETIDTQETKVKELDENDTSGCLGNLKSPVIFEELDEVWISTQHDDRRNRGAAKSKRKKAGKKPMHIGVAYMGWTRLKDGSYSTENKVAYASFGGAHVFASRFETILRHCFDMDGVEHRLTNGDGEPWIRSAAEATGSILQLDAYHRSQADIKGVSDKSDRKRLFYAIYEKDVLKVLDMNRNLIMKAGDGKTQEKLKKLYGYFESNSDIILTWQGHRAPFPAGRDVLQRPWHSGIK